MADEELLEENLPTNPPLDTPGVDETPGDSFNDELDTPTEEEGNSDNNIENTEGVESDSNEESEEQYTGTQFSAIYNRFLGKITDDMYMELTPADTIRDLQNLLLDAIPGFEFPRVVLDDYALQTQVINEADAKPGDFILAVLWQELPEDGEQEAPDVLVERSCFRSTLTPEEINILATLMKLGWVQRQVASIELTRMKYSGADFKMTSQANHLARLITLQKTVQEESVHMQRLYKRRKVDSDGRISSNWGSIMERHVFR